MIRVKDILHLLNETDQIRGDTDKGFTKLGDAEHIDEDTLDWIHPNRQDALEYLRSSRASVIIAPLSLISEDLEFAKDKTLIFTKNPILLFTRIATDIFVKKPDPGIHENTLIADEATIGNNVYIGPFCHIGKCEIGDDCIIHSHVFIGDNVTIGNNVLIKSGARLGHEGFGFVKSEIGEIEKFPQVGGLMIGNDVEIGGNTCIDRGSLSNSIIEDGVKINNLCHIAHNVLIGENTIIAGNSTISGSTTIGANVWIGPNVCFRGHQHIGKSALIGAGAVVIGDVPDGEVWVGNPARYLRDRKE
ncbi:MAG: UDP-3-O-(3-hydroxymyristoyl)glucosamine N-acyltransferase [Candidatus Cloacimonetes bacterium]|nr:UDP-3-O-(3-hydroxymyristoyl)glucosamine N-acyltransferase [Candidatus Cloacimonadota bacterium]